jgi:hypothetical protein
MKITTRIFTAVLIIFCYSLSQAQMGAYTPSQWTEMHKKSINNASYIFEGTVIQQKCYYAKRGEIFTCSIIQITKIFKGSIQLKLGTIKVLTYQGGQVDKNGPKSIVYDGGGLGKGKEHLCIIFGITATDGLPLDSTALQSMITNNNLMLNMIDVIGFTSSGPQWGETNYKTTDSLYSFFKENGVTVEEEVEEKK